MAKQKVTAEARKKREMSSRLWLDYYKDEFL